MITCPSCGASNPESAAWCGQCLTSFQPARQPQPAAGTPASTAQAAQAEAVPAAHASAGSGFVTREGNVEWICVGCGAPNDLGVDVCSVCGTPFAARWASEEPQAPPAEKIRLALVLSAITPGAGHLLLGRNASGVTRVLLFVVWLGGVLALISAGGPVLLTTAPLILGVLAVWSISLVDVLHLGRGQPEILTGRLVLWLVAGVVGLEVVALLGAAMTLR